MLPTPTKFALVAGRGEGVTKLVAFDNALLDAGIGNLNLIRVSSILPPGARRAARLAIPPGSLVPTAYGAITSTEPGETIAAAVAVGLAPPSYGIIMEYSGRTGRDEAARLVEEMLLAAFAARGITPAATEVRAVEHTVVRTGCALAAVILWY
ncbi:MAG: arginine decarboxylase, pyruvoyl-dependent [Bacillota bacterium]